MINQDCKFRDSDSENTFCYRLNRILGRPYNCEAIRCTKCDCYKKSKERTYSPKGTYK